MAKDDYTEGNKNISESNEHANSGTDSAKR